MDALPSDKRPRDRPRTHWQNNAKDLAWSRLRIPPAQLPLVAEDWNAWRFQLELLPPQPQKDKRVKGNTLNKFNVFPKNDDNDDDDDGDGTLGNINCIFQKELTLTSTKVFKYYFLKSQIYIEQNNFLFFTKQKFEDLNECMTCSIKRTSCLI